MCVVPFGFLKGPQSCQLEARTQHILEAQENLRLWIEETHISIRLCKSVQQYAHRPSLAVAIKTTAVPR